MIDDLARADDGTGIANLTGDGEKGEEGKGTKKPGEEEDEVNHHHPPLPYLTIYLDTRSKHTNTIVH